MLSGRYCCRIIIERIWRSANYCICNSSNPSTGNERNTDKWTLNFLGLFEDDLSWMSDPSCTRSEHRFEFYTCWRSVRKYLYSVFRPLMRIRICIIFLRSLVNCLVGLILLMAVFVITEFKWKEMKVFNSSSALLRLSKNVTTGVLIRGRP